MSGLGAMMAGGNPATGRQADDFYPTPPEVTQALLRRYPRLAEEWIWEPAAGDFAMAAELEAIGAEVSATDINPRSPRVGRHDFLDSRTISTPFTAIITNPPFNLAAKFIERAHFLARNSPSLSFVALVLKSTYWHAASRTTLFRNWPPTAIHPLTWRPDFMGRGAPTMEISWAVWDLENPLAHFTSYEPMSRPQ